MSRFILGLLIGGITTLLIQKAIRMRRDSINDRAIHPRGAYKHFRKLEEAGADRLRVDAIINRATEDVEFTD
tara:strand:- start:1175 stop:1390 length:216 start_codon:yes stop_codon:yes gene_type:complete